MADSKNNGIEDAYNKNNINPSPFFNRSMTINASANFTNKHILNVYDSPALFHRNGSIKGSYTSAFGSMVYAGNLLKKKVRKLCSIFESTKHPLNPTGLQALLSPLSSPTQTNPKKLKLEYSASNLFVVSRNVLFPPFRLPGTEDRVVIYFTSLRGIRRTFQDCHSIRMLFRGFRVNIDERDVSMDAAYKKELQRVLSENNIRLPQVFIKGKYIGGVDVINQLLEAGELVRLIKGLSLRSLEACEACNDVRFIPCMNCDGSRKVFNEIREQSIRCPECNENGVVRCPVCCS